MAKKRRKPPKIMMQELHALNGGKCYVRNCDLEIVEDHHIDGDSSNKDAGNIIPLCAQHHQLDVHRYEAIPPYQLKLYKLWVEQGDILIPSRFFSEISEDGRSFMQLFVRQLETDLEMPWTARVPIIVGWSIENFFDNLSRGFFDARWNETKRAWRSAVYPGIHALEFYGYIKTEELEVIDNRGRHYYRDALLTVKGYNICRAIIDNALESAERSHKATGRGRKKSE